MRYPGGKGKCFQNIINIMPPHKVYIESHLGGGAVMRNKKPADINIGIDIDKKVIKTWLENAPIKCKLINEDSLEYLKKFNFSGNELIYSDPPYLTSTRKQSKIYRHEYDINDHILFLELIKKINSKVIISGYDNELYNDVLIGWNKTQFAAKTHTYKSIETIWFNYEMPTILHDTNYIGSNFREREKIKRKLNNIKKRLNSLSPIEKNEISFWLNNNVEDNYE
jgi:site-specific DNA-adenine methylase